MAEECRATAERSSSAERGYHTARSPRRRPPRGAPPVEAALAPEPCGSNRGGHHRLTRVITPSAAGRNSWATAPPTTRNPPAERRQRECTSRQPSPPHAVAAAGRLGRSTGRTAVGARNRAHRTRPRESGGSYPGRARWRTAPDAVRPPLWLHALSRFGRPPRFGRRPRRRHAPSPGRAPPAPRSTLSAASRWPPGPQIGADCLPLQKQKRDTVLTGTESKRCSTSNSNAKDSSHTVPTLEPTA